MSRRILWLAGGLLVATLLTPASAPVTTPTTPTAPTNPAEKESVSSQVLK